MGVDFRRVFHKITPFVSQPFSEIGKYVWERQLRWKLEELPLQKAATFSYRSPLGPKAPGPLESGWGALAPQTPEMQASEAVLFRFPCIRSDQEIARGALCFAGRAPG